MGILDRAKKAVGMDDNGGEPETSFEEEFEEPDEPETFEEEEEDEVIHEWDTAYQFADDVIENIGFTDVKEFVDKSMIYRINQSPMYRDRIESGVRTMDMISSSMSNIHDLRGQFGGEGGERDYQKHVEQVRAANNLIDELDRMEGKEEEMANEIISIARDAVEGLKDRNTGGGNVDSSMGVTRE